MPEGTLHAVRNVTPALSYHRFPSTLQTRRGLLARSGGWRLPRHPTGGDPVERRARGDDGAGQCRGYWRSGRMRWIAPVLTETTASRRSHCSGVLGERPARLRSAGDSVNSFDWRALLADADDALGLWAGGGGQRKNVPSPDKKSQKVGATSRRSPEDSLYEPSVGDVVAVRFHAKQVRARVVDVASPSKPPRFCRVHYATYGNKYDELVECSSLRPRTDGAKLVVKVGAKCKVPWGDSSDESSTPPRHRRDACSMAWRCRFLTARRVGLGPVGAEKSDFGPNWSPAESKTG